MDLRPSTLKALFLEGMRKANEANAPDEPNIPETTTPPPPTEPPTVHKPPPAPGRAVEPGYTEWRNGRPWHITPAPVPEPEPKPKPEPEQVDEDGAQDAEDPEDYEGEEWDGEERKAGRLSRFRPTFRGAVAPSYRPAPYGVRPDPRRSLSEWWYELDPIRRWMLYNGVALAAGFYFHLPQMVTQRTAYVLDTYHSLTDQHVITCYVIAAVVWLFDHVSRRWPFLVSLVFRVPLISLVIGFLLNGSHTLPN